MNAAFFMPVFSGNINLAFNTTQSLKKWEPEIPVFFSSEMDNNPLLEQYGKVITGGEKGWRGRRYAREMAFLVKEHSFDFIIKLDPDAYCIKSGGVKAVSQGIEKNPVIGSVMGNGFFSCGGVVAMRGDFIIELSNFAFSICEDTTRTLLLKSLGFKVFEIPEIVSNTKDNIPNSEVCLVHKFIKLRSS